MRTNDGQGDLVFNTAILVLFASITLTGLMHHEIWLDEAHHWLLARDSTSIKHLWINTRYEGHPILWNFILFCINRFTSEVFYMQLAHWLAIVMAAAVFIFYSPFARLQRFLFVMGYYFIYEYAVISRNYALLLLLLFCSIVFYERKRYLLAGLALALLSNTHFFGFVIASCFAAMAACEFIIRKQTPSRGPAIGGAALFAIGAALCLWQVIPPSDSVLIPNAQKLPAFERLGRASAIFLKGFIPIPDLFQYSYWNTNLLMSFSKALCAALSFIIFCIPALVFRKHFSLLLFYYAVALMLLVFVFVTDLNAVRYYGTAYIVFIGCMWLCNTAPETRSPRIAGLKGFDEKPLLVALLVIQAAAGFIALAFDISRPFSGSKEAARIIKAEGQSLSVLSGGCGSAPVSAYLGEKIYYLNQKTYGSFCYLNKNEVPLNSPEELANAAIAFVKKTRKTAMLVAHRPMAVPIEDGVTMVLVDSPAKSTLRNEHYHVYRISLTSGIDR